MLAQAELERAQVVMGLDPLRLREQREREVRKGKETRKNVSKFFREAGCSREEEARIKRKALLILLIAGGLFFLLHTPGILVGGGVALLILFLSVSRKRKRKIDHFDKDYAAFLLSLASSVRTGLDPLTALTLSGEVFHEESEVRAAIGRVKSAIDRGDSEEKAIQAFGANVAHPDIKLFTTALILSRKEGASIGDSLHRLSRVTRQRQSFRRKIKTALAMQKLSAFGISLSAIALTLIQVGTNPEAVKTAMEHPIGSKALLFGGFFMALGLFWMSRMARAKV